MQGAAFLLSLAGAATFIVALVRLSLWVRPPRHHKEENWYRDSENHRRKRNSYKPGVRTLAANIDAIRDELYAQRRQQNHHENSRSLLEKFGVGAAVTAALLAGYSAWIFQGQLDEARNEQRPWIKVSVSIASDLVFSGDDATATLLISAENTGHMPAMYAFPVAVAFLATPTRDPVVEQRRACDGLRNKGPIGPIMFPGDHYPQPWKFRIDMKDLQKGLAMNLGSFVHIIVAGCVDYVFPIEKGHHQTRFSYRFLRLRNISPTHGIGIFPADGDVPASDIGLGYFPAEANSAD